MRPRPHSWYLAPAPGVPDLGLALTGAGWIEGQNRRHEGRVLPHHAAVLVTEGTGSLRLGCGPLLPVGTGSLFCLPADVPHSYGPLGGASWSERWILFEGHAARAYEQLGCLGAARPVARPGDSTELADAFGELTTLAREPASLSRDVTAAALLHRLIALTAPPPPPATAGPASLARQAVALLDDHDGRPVSLARLARRLGVSPDALTAAVRTATGCTPTEYLLRRRMARARTLLTTTDLTVAAVGRRVGYDDPAYFSRLFARRVGAPPSVYRRRPGNSAR
ncbi:helix-turn-helix domain-containing protein [Streptomyces sp. SID8379]|uniref:helix-turn-helix transcriptional regulator n=1 Tax=unclassified Streptomyces TaxID=2593676 RepID=UPI00035DA6FE|nr:MULTISPECIES: helix-turn-helix domain-containing protein [unclassified Streptomyces]MYW69348.1 helix-turn-helix domain-containing protein [Streptomyces sp. SID8379]MYW69417.1 helix-turn-helix domain-containing protein [Streptomyces sp. SID8379]